MRVDLFEFVEGVIKGIVYFFYNVVETLWQILRHPIRGPVRLQRTYKRKGQQQIGGLTFLLLVLFVAFGSFENGPSAYNLSEPLQRLGAPPSFESQAAWLPLLGALIVTIVIDTALRLVARLRWGNRRTRRELIVGAAEFAITIPVIVSMPAEILLNYDWDGGILRFIWAFALPIFVAHWPAAYILLLPRRSAHRLKQRSVRVSLYFVTQVAMLALVTAAFFVSGVTVNAVRTASARAVARVQLTSANCNLRASPPYVEFVLFNRSDRPVLLYPERDLMVTVPTSRYSSTSVGAGDGTGIERPLVINPGDSKFLRLDVPSTLLAEARRARFCYVQGFSTEFVIDTDPVFTIGDAVGPQRR